MPDSVHLVGASDEAHLAFALADDRVIVTHDSDFSVLHARGFAHAGIMFCHPTKYSVGELIDALVLLHQCLTAEEMRNHLEYL